MILWILTVFDRTLFVLPSTTHITQLKTLTMNYSRFVKMKYFILNTKWTFTEIIFEHRKLCYNLDFPRNHLINFLQNWVRNSIDEVQRLSVVWCQYMFVVFCSDERKFCPQPFRKGLFAAPNVTLWLTHSRKPPNPLPPVASVCFYPFCPLNKGKREENAIQMNVQFVFVFIVL
jgi:hypothetical protein